VTFDEMALDLMTLWPKSWSTSKSHFKVLTELGYTNTDLSLEETEIW